MYHQAVARFEEFTPAPEDDGTIVARQSTSRIGTPRRFAASAGPIALDIEVASDGAARCVGLIVRADEGEALTTEALRRIPLARMAKEAVAEAARSYTPAEPGGEPIFRLTSTPRDAHAAFYESVRRHGAGASPRVSDYGRQPARSGPCLSRGDKARRPTDSGGGQCHARRALDGGEVGHGSTLSRLSWPCDARKGRRGMKGSIFKRGNLWTVQIERDRDPVTGQAPPRVALGLQDEAARPRLPGSRSSPTCSAASTSLLTRSLSGPSSRTSGCPAMGPSLRASTYEGYMLDVRRVVDRIGERRLQSLTPAILNRLYGELGEHLAPRTIRGVHTVLRQALADAVAWERLPRNPADRAKPPSLGSLDEIPPRTWSARQLDDFLEHAARRPPLCSVARPRDDRGPPRRAPRSLLERGRPRCRTGSRSPGR